MACVFHKWDGCTCTKCGKARDEQHKFYSDFCDEHETCEACGKKQKRDENILAAEIAEARLADLKFPMPDFDKAARNMTFLSLLANQKPNTLIEAIKSQNVSFEAFEGARSTAPGLVWVLLNAEYTRWLEDPLNAVWPVIYMMASEEEALQKLENQNGIPLDANTATTFIKETLSAWFDKHRK